MLNSYRLISAFIVRCKLQGLTPSLDLFHHFFQVALQNADGFLSVAARPKRKLFEGAPTSIHDWKYRFFFLRYSDERLPVRWNGYPPKITPPELAQELQGAIDKLKLGGVKGLKEFLTIQALSDAGIGLPPTQDQMDREAMKSRHEAKAATLRAAQVKARDSGRSITFW
ncbi:unnamed protein product [Cuscuta europaea]|uniref:Uncharacterized protein n=1 Tax=Cuscuta europaea TaxID=41803 RepID=A0A9P0ZC41_CUSEU|nr:unnamed protein product [Cuscuta europaea]